MTPLIIYCYDAYCGWCYGFSPVIKKTAAFYKDRFSFEVLSGGMIIMENPRPIGVSAAYIREAYKTVEAHTGVTFGADYLWHVNHPELSDWFPSSEKPAIALCVVKEILPGRQVDFAASMQYAHHYEGRDLTDDEAYRHLLQEYGLDPETFYERLHNETYREKAYYEFSLVKQLQVTGFPTVLMQVSESKFYLLSRGYTDFDTLQQRIENVLKTIATENPAS